MNKETIMFLIDNAKKVALNAHVHLSNYQVGSAILSESDHIYVGCNIEFDNYSNTIHAEESAISSFISAGEKKMKAIVIFTFENKPVYPCGMCRQSLSELGGSDLQVISAFNDDYEIMTMKDLLPYAFKLEK